MRGCSWIELERLRMILDRVGATRKGRAFQGMYINLIGTVYATLLLEELLNLGADG